MIEYVSSMARKGVRSLGVAALVVGLGNPVCTLVYAPREASAQGLPSLVTLNSLYATSMALSQGYTSSWLVAEEQQAAIALMSSSLDSFDYHSNSHLGALNYLANRLEEEGVVLPSEEKERLSKVASLLVKYVEQNPSPFARPEDARAKAVKAVRGDDNFVSRRTPPSLETTAVAEQGEKQQRESGLTSRLTARETAGRLPYVFDGTGNPNVYYNKVEDALYFFGEGGELERIETLGNIFFIDENRGEIRDAEGRAGGEETAGGIRANLEEEFRLVESEEELTKVDSWLDNCAVRQIAGRRDFPLVGIGNILLLRRK